ncbi:S13A4 protein, partial [Atractosteus spatula]|nr:S13A4 protein [Atractosteus spatula]
EASCAYVLIVTAVYWVSEAVPLGAAALVPAFLYPLFGVLKSSEVILPPSYVTETPGLRVSRDQPGTAPSTLSNENRSGWNIPAVKRLLHNLYLSTRPSQGGRKKLFAPQYQDRLVLGFMCCTVFLSMWLSNTSTTAMVMPIAEAVLQQLISTGVADAEEDSETVDTQDDDGGGGVSPPGPGQAHACWAPVGCQFLSVWDTPFRLKRLSSSSLSVWDTPFRLKRLSSSSLSRHSVNVLLTRKGRNHLDLFFLNGRKNKYCEQHKTALGIIAEHRKVFFSLPRLKPAGVVADVLTRRCRPSQAEIFIPEPQKAPEKPAPRYPTKRDHMICKCLSLSITYAATIGGLITITGTSTNLIFAEQFNSRYPEAKVINFGTWFIFSLPISLVMLFLTWLWLHCLFLGCNFRETCSLSKKRKTRREELSERRIQEEYEKLGPVRWVRITRSSAWSSGSGLRETRSGQVGEDYEKLGPVSHMGCVTRGASACPSPPAFLFLSALLPGAGGRFSALAPPRGGVRRKSAIREKASWPKGYRTDATISVLLGFLLFLIPARKPWPSASGSAGKGRGETSVLRRLSPRSLLTGGSPEGGADSDPMAPMITWKDFQKLMPWEIVILVGGGYALAAGCKVSGLSVWIGRQMEPMSGLPPWTVTLLACLLVSTVTEFASNPATLTVFLPILSTLSETLRINPLHTLIPATMCVSFGVMLPVGNPPNAIVFSYGHCQIKDMVKAGFGVNLIGVAVVMVAIMTWGEPLFQLSEFPDWAVLRNVTDSF